MPQLACLCAEALAPRACSATPHAPRRAPPLNPAPTPPRTTTRRPSVRQVDIATHLGHSLNVCHFHGAYESEVAVLLVLDYCSGGQLWDRVQVGTRPPPSSAPSCPPPWHFRGSTLLRMDVCRCLRQCWCDPVLAAPAVWKVWRAAGSAHHPGGAAHCGPGAGVLAGGAGVLGGGVRRHAGASPHAHEVKPARPSISTVPREARDDARHQTAECGVLEPGWQRRSGAAHSRRSGRRSRRASVALTGAAPTALPPPPASSCLPGQRRTRR